jgi:C1A family cysteine protease
MYKAKHLYKLKKDVEDQRDFSFYAVKYKKIKEIPKKIDLRSSCSDVVDQGNLGSCTANAIVSGLREYLEIQNKTKFIFLSRLFLYYEERRIENTINEDSGASLRDGMKILNKEGVCPELDDPYIIAKFKQKPSKQAYLHAKKYKIQQYSRVWDLESLKVSLAENLPVVAGIKVFSSFESVEVAKSGIVPIPKPWEPLLGGHAVLAIGYDEDKKWVILRNSWGTSWGDNGYFYIPYKVFNFLVMDMWTGTSQIQVAKTSTKNKKLFA